MLIFTYQALKGSRKMVHVRVRLRFDSSPLHYAKKCWFVFDADQCSLVKDVAYLIARQFGLTQGIQLYMDDFLIPVNESAHVIRDNDLIRVVAVECGSSNTIVVLSEEEQSSKVKRRKTGKSESQTNSKANAGAAHAVTPKSSTTKSVKPLSKVGEPSNKSKSAGGQLKAVTRKSSSGALHITFQSSSSSESSSESASSSSSSSDSSESDTTVSKQRRNNTAISKVNIAKVANIVQTPSPSVKATPASINRSPAAGAKSDNRQTDVTANRRSRRKRKKTLSTNVTVGGNHDVLTTKSTLFKSPVLNKKLPGPGTNPKLQSIATNSQSSSTAADMAKKVAVPTTNTKTGGREAKKRISQWDVQPTAPTAVGLSPLPIVNSSATPAAAEQPTLPPPPPPPRDYSTLPDLLGPPRQGDKLAFKLLEMSSSYTPVISEYKEATVLGVDSSSKLIQMEYTEETLRKLKHSKEREKPGKFELEMDREEDDGEPQVLEKSVEITLDALVEPKLVT